MSDCIFCKIVNKELTCYKVYEDDDYLAFLDIYPVVKGHTLVIPKKHYRWTYDVPDFGGYWQTVLKVTKKIQKALSPSWVNFGTHGLIPHAHIHILPRQGEPGNQPVFPTEKLTFSENEMKEISEKILKQAI